MTPPPARGDPREYFDRLSSPDAAVRLKACAHLLKIWIDAREEAPAAVIEAIYRALLDREASVRGVVQRWLVERPEIVLTMTAEERNLAAVTVARAILKERELVAVRGLTEIVGGLSQRAVCQVLENAIDGDDAAAVANAAFALGRIIGYRGVVVETMRNKHPLVRAAALFGVGEAEPANVEDVASFVADLVRFLEDAGPLADLVRAKAAAIIGPRRAVVAVAALANAHRHGDPTTRHNARYALLAGGADFADALESLAATDPHHAGLVADLARLRQIAASPGSSAKTHEAQSPWFPMIIQLPSRAEIESHGLLAG